MVTAIVKAMKTHLPEHYFGKFAFELEFRNSEVYKVENVLNRQSLDVDRLK